MSKRQQIVDAIAARLRTITKGITIELETGDSYTYQTDLGSNVEPWREDAFSADETEGLTFRDSDGSLDDADVTSHQDHALDIDVFATSGKALTDAAGRQWLEDILAAVGIDRTWGGLAFNTRPRRASLNVEEQGRHLVGASLSFVVRYRTQQFRI